MDAKTAASLVGKEVVCTTPYQDWSLLVGKKYRILNYKNTRFYIQTTCCRTGMEIGHDISDGIFDKFFRYTPDTASERIKNFLINNKELKLKDLLT